MATAAINPSDAELQQDFAAIVGRSLRIDPARVVPGVTLSELGAESLDLVEITIDVENHFAILMPERSILEIGTEVLGEGVLEREGTLTEVGRRLLARRMPELSAAELEAIRDTRDLQQLFMRVDTWLRVIRFVLDHSPRECPTCRVGLVTGSPARLRCPACGAEVDLPEGDDLNRAWVRTVARLDLESGEHPAR